MNMKGIFLALGLIVFTAGCATPVTNTNTPPAQPTQPNKTLADLRRLDDLLSCTEDSDCISIRNGSCCHCRTEAINKKYKDEWSSIVATLKPCTGDEFCTQEAVRCGTEPKCSNLGKCYLD